MDLGLAGVHSAEIKFLRYLYEIDCLTFLFSPYAQKLTSFSALKTYRLVSAAARAVLRSASAQTAVLTDTIAPRSSIQTETRPAVQGRAGSGHRGRSVQFLHRAILCRALNCDVRWTSHPASRSSLHSQPEGSYQSQK